MSRLRKSCRRYALSSRPRLGESLYDYLTGKLCLSVHRLHARSMKRPDEHGRRITRRETPEKRASCPRHAINCRQQKAPVLDLASCGQATDQPHGATAGAGRATSTSLRPVPTVAKCGEAAQCSSIFLAGRLPPSGVMMLLFVSQERQVMQKPGKTCIKASVQHAVGDDRHGQHIHVATSLPCHEGSFQLRCAPRAVGSSIRPRA